MAPAGTPFRRLLAAALVAAAVPAAGQETVAPRGFGEVLDVRLVNIEAWVTDRKGRPIRGLGPDDFEVLEDGRPVEITHFAEVVGGDPDAGGAIATTTPASAAGAPVAPAAVWPSHLVLYFDDLHLAPIGRRRLIQDLREFVTSGEAPAGRVLVMRQEHNLYTEVPFGSSPVEVELGLDRIAEAAFRGAQVSREKRLVVSRLQDLWRQSAEQSTVGVAPQDPCGFFMPRAVPLVEVYAREARDRTAISVGHLASVVRFLAGVPGNKTLLYMSDQLETSPGNDLVEVLRAFCPNDSTSLDLSSADGSARAFVDLSRHANANRVTVYSLQGSGLSPGSLISAEQTATDFRAVPRFQSVQRAAERDGMVTLADQTGGRAVFDTNRFAKALGKIAVEMDSYYSLGYAPPHGGDAGDHEIEVRVRMKKTRVRHRRGYRDKTPDERLEERLLSALYLGQVSNPLGLRLGQGRVVGTSSGKYQVPLHVMVPPERVAFLPGEEGAGARLKVRVLVRNVRGDRVADRESVFLVERPPEAFDRPLSLPVELALGDGLQIVAVALRDEATMEASYVSTSFVLGRPTAR